jgi:Protein of unknown function (DUF1153)
MNQVGAPRRKAVRGPDGSVLTIADLPSPSTKRWVIRRKAIIAAAVRGGLISLDEACSRYRLNPEELLSWQYYIDRYGFSALRVTKVQEYVRPANTGGVKPAVTYNISRPKPDRPSMNAAVTCLLGQSDLVGR